MGFGDGGFGHGFGWIWHAALTVVAGIAWLVALAVGIAVVVLLVRFLLVATTAARIYIRKNSDAPETDEPAASTASPPESAARAATEPTTIPATSVATTKPVKVRKPKAPPA